METSLKFKQIYSDEHMIEISVDITTNKLSTNISCYTQIEMLQELNKLCNQLVTDLKSFDWAIGSKEYSYFKMSAYPYDKVGHIKVDFILINNKEQTIFDRMYCECCLIFELGKIEQLGQKIIKLSNNDFDLVEIKHNIDL